MRRALAVITLALLQIALSPHAGAEERPPDSNVGTIPGAVRVVVTKAGGEHTVHSVSGGAGDQVGCHWTLTFLPDLDDVTYGTSAGPKPHPEARLALLLCNGAIVQPIWVAPDDIVDLDAAAADEAERYVEDVLVPAVRLGVNPAAKGLVGLDSWFWIEGFDGSMVAPPITAFGLTLEVRMSSSTITWDFGDGTVEPGDLGRAYPEESTVRHVHQYEGTFTITASIDLVPEYRVDGGPWLLLPNLVAVATTTHPVGERQAVVTQI